MKLNFRPSTFLELVTLSLLFLNVPRAFGGDARPLQQSDLGSPQARERVSECIEEIKTYCTLPRYRGDLNGCVEGLVAEMVDPAMFPDSLRRALSFPSGNVALYVSGQFWAGPGAPAAIYEPVLACLAQGRKKSRNPCDNAPRFTLSSSYDPDTNYCTYQLTGHSEYLEQCWIFGNEVGLYPERSGGWSLPGQCNPNPPVSCKVWPTNPNGYNYNNKICRQSDDAGSANPCEVPPKYSVTYSYDADTNYCTYQLTNQSAYQEQCWIGGNELGPFPGRSGGWSLPGQCNGNLPVSCRIWPTNPNGYAYNNSICKNHEHSANK